MNITVYQDDIPFFEFAIPADELLEGTELFIGRSDDCHIVLDDQRISRYHAKVLVRPDGIYIQNNSEFGQLQYNGRSVTEMKLAEASRVAIENFVLQFAQIEDAQVQKVQTPVSFVAPEEPVESAQPVQPAQTIQPEPQIQDYDEPTELMSETEQEEEEELTQSESEENTDQEQEDFLSSSDEDNDNGYSSEQTDEYQSPSENTDEQSSESIFDNSDGFSETEDGFNSEGDGFGDDMSMGDDMSDSSDGTQVFQTFASYFLRLEGEYAPFDRFQIESEPVHIGRDPEKCQICLPDGEVSSVHAVIKKNLISCVLEDLNSSNGTKLNGERINKAELVNGDEIQIGSTKIFVEIKSDLIEAEKDILMPVDTNQVIEVEEIIEEEVDFDELQDQGAEEIPEKSLIKRIMKDPKKKRIVMIVAVLLLLVLLLDDDEKIDDKSGDSKPVVAEGAADPNAETENANKKQLTPEMMEKLEQNYQLALAKYEINEFNEAKTYLEIVMGIDDNYKNSQTLYKLIKQAMEEIARIKKEEQEEIERKKRQLEVQKLVEKAKEAVKNREVRVAEGLFGQIAEKDPENIDVPQLRLEIDAYKKEIEEKRLAEEAAKAKRNRMVEALTPGKSLFLKEDWYRAIGTLEEFVNLKDMDEDLMREGADMLNTARSKLRSLVDPLVGQARSYKEGQDLKRAYETFGQVLKYDPGHEEALNEREDIKTILETRSRKVYREALIAESLSLFEESKEKFQEVQQISPQGSEYYIKATEKLRDYLE